jgi:hypothetical protein
MANLTIGDLRKLLADSHSTWRIDARLKDDQVIPVHPTGAVVDKLKRAKEVAPVDLKAVLRVPPANPALLQYRVSRGFIAPESAAAHPTAIFVPSIPAAVVRPTVVDWRNRFGWNWITTIQDQGPCESCWAFAATALVSSMVRIEHAVWSKRSEGDVHDGMGAKCANTGNVPAALDWIVNNGICDPDCYPYKTDDSAYTPTADRSGRTVKISGYQELGDIEQQKDWIDQVGPLAVCFAVYNDFFAYSSGVYHRLNDPNNTLAGYHCVLIVGYDDVQNAWIVKNSWGTGWGESGYAYIGYGEADIDTWSKIGLQDTNPDPWTKRRIHNGSMYESGDGGRHDNFELVTTISSGQIRHRWRDNGTAGFPWAVAEAFGIGDALGMPSFTGTTYNRNFECIYRTKSNTLHHYFFDQNTKKWNDGGTFASGILDDPGFIQGNYGAPGNFEVVVLTQGNKLAHWWRTNGPPWTWSNSATFGSNIICSGPTLVQSHYGGQGNFEVVAVNANGQLQHFWRDNDHGMVWNTGVAFGSGYDSNPYMVEGQFGATTEQSVANFELVIAKNGKVDHWWRDNAGGGMNWNFGTTFGHDVARVIALVEGSFGFNLEVIVLRFDGLLQHYWRDGAGWHEGVIIGTP